MLKERQKHPTLRLCTFFLISSCGWCTWAAPGCLGRVSYYHKNYASSMILLWERKLSILSTLPPSFFTLPVKGICTARKTLRPLPSLFGKLSFTPGSSQCTITLQLQKVLKWVGWKLLQAERWRSNTTTQNADFCITDTPIYSQK